MAMNGVDCSWHRSIQVVCMVECGRLRLALSRTKCAKFIFGTENIPDP